MPVRIESEVGKSLEAALAALLPGEPYLGYRLFPPFQSRPDELNRYHGDRWRRAAAYGRAWVARAEDGQPIAMIAAEPRAFESEHFSLRIANISAPAAVADGIPRRAALADLYQHASQQLAGEGFQHLTCAAAAGDGVASRALQEIGAFYCGTKISWMQQLRGPGRPVELPPNLTFHAYDRDSIPTLKDDDWRALWRWTATAFDRGPFVFDYDVPGDRAQALYQVWTEKAFRGEWADALLVVRDGREIVAFHTMMHLPELSEAAGVKIVGRGIGGSMPGYPGLFTALQLLTSHTRPLGAEFLENEAQAASIGSLRVFAKLGHRCIASTSSFHLKLARAQHSRRGDPLEPDPTREK